MADAFKSIQGHYQIGLRCPKQRPRNAFAEDMLTVLGEGVVKICNLMVVSAVCTYRKNRSISCIVYNEPTSTPKQSSTDKLASI